MTTKKKKHGGSGSGALRASLFHGGGAPSFPSPTSTTTTTRSSPYRTRPFAAESVRNNAEPSASPTFGDFDHEDEIDQAYAYHYASASPQVERKRREMGWSTSFPAEYHHAHQSRDYQQTLAFQEQLDQRKRSDQQITDALLTNTSTTSSIPPKRGGATNAKPSSSSPIKHELELLKHVAMREGILAKLHTLADVAAASGGRFDAETGSELLQLLLHLRDASVGVVSAMATWHRSTASRAPLRAFVFQNQNYCVKMVSDLNFLAQFRSLSRVLGVDAARMTQNPFMMPSPIPDRDFHSDHSGHGEAQTPPRFSFADPVQRVAEAEKYLVWCLVHLADVPTSSVTHQPASSVLLPHQLQPQPQQLPQSSQSARELLTWQQRAEKQLRMLSMPLESRSGQAHVMDSSRMMKRKGYLPALPLSPPKTLTQLMDNVHKGGYTSPTKSSGFASLEAVHNGITYRMTALDIEVLGSNDAPPHAIVTLVSASVLILLSPSDRIPKDLSWSSCQKMLSNGLRLVQRIESVAIDAIPMFKWKALLPFRANEHFDPMFLMEYSCAAATMCAWVLHVLDAAQQQHSLDSVAEMKQDTDRRELLKELEREDEDASVQPCARGAVVTPLPSALRPPSRASSSAASRSSGKRVTIGNAEVLFINENETVSPPPSASAASTSRPVSSSSLSSSIVAQPRRHVLLRTSPWTHRAVTYFVSFFLEKSDHHDGEREMLSIKMYEPMSSVESQMFVSLDDLALDFGDRAAEFFQRRDFGLLCELILSQLDGMVTSGAPGSAALSRNEWRRPSLTETDGDKTNQTTGRQEEEYEEEEYEEEEDQDPQEQGNEEGEEGEGEEQEDGQAAAAAAVRIQCLARRQHATKRVETLRTQRKDGATVRIQCAIRQRRARDKVQHVRFARQQQQEHALERSAVKIQSVARQRQAKHHVANMKLLQRTPTGLPGGPDGGGGGDGGGGDDDDDGGVDGGDDNAEPPHDRDDDTAQQAETSEVEAQAPPVDHMSQGDLTRPETSMSYASEQFEEDFETED